MARSAQPEQGDDAFDGTDDEDTGCNGLNGNITTCTAIQIMRPMPSAPVSQGASGWRATISAAATSWPRPFIVSRTSPGTSHDPNGVASIQAWGSPSGPPSGFAISCSPTGIAISAVNSWSPTAIQA